MKKIIVFVVLIGLVFGCTNHSSKEVFKLDVINSNQGYGYTISIYDTIRIKQEFIPGLMGNKPFKTKEQAKKIGTLVIEKLKSKGDPTISLEDLKKEGIDLN